LSNEPDQVLDGGLLLTGKLLNQWFLLDKLNSSMIWLTGTEYHKCHK
jgi:hypothetical protein